MRILILGGSGNVGAAFAAAAVADGHEVWSTFRRQPSRQIPGSRSVHWDASRGAPPAELNDFNPHVVLHAIADVDPDACESNSDRAQLVNAESVSAAVSLLKPRLLVYVSSDYVFDGRRGRYTTAFAPAPLNAYGRTKLNGESLAGQASGWLVIRTALFGAGTLDGPRSRWERHLQDLAAGRAVTVATDQVGTPLWTQTLAKVSLRLIERRQRGIVHAAGPERVTKAELLRRLAEHLHIPIDRINALATSKLDTPARRPLDVSLVASPVVRHLAGYPTSLDVDIGKYARSIWSPGVATDPADRQV